MAATNKTQKIIPKLTCACCEETLPEDDFFRLAKSEFWNGRDKRVPICKICLEKIFIKVSRAYNSKIAILYICAFLNIPYRDKYYQSMMSQADNSNLEPKLGNYIKLFNAPSNQGLSFLETLTTNEIFLGLDSSDIKENELDETRWKKNDKKNKEFIIETYGYDPFKKEGLQEEDRKFCFSLCSSYIRTNEHSKTDGYLKNIIITLVISHLQVQKLDDFIAKHFINDILDKDKLTSIINTRSKLVNDIKNIAQTNNLSSAFEEVKADNKAFTAKMDEALKNGYFDMEVDMYDVKTSKAIENIIYLSHKNIQDRIHFGEADSVDMIKEQREMILKLKKDLLNLQEENRNLKNYINGYVEKTDNKKSGEK